MKLRMDHGARKRNQAPLAATYAPGDDAANRPVLDRRRHPLSARSERALAKLRPGELHDTALRKTRAVDFPNTAATHEKDPAAIRMDSRRIRMYRRPVGELANLAVRERGFEQLRAPAAVGSEDQRLAIRSERALQEVRRMADGRMIGQLADGRAGHAVGVNTALRCMPRSLAERHLRSPSTGCGPPPARRSSGP